MSGAEFARFARDLARAASGIDRKANAAIDRVGRGALATARVAAPTDTGALRQGLSLRRQGSRAVVESDTYYSAFQEFGTSQMAPNPFMGPAIDRWAPELVREVERIRDGVVDEL